MVVDAVQTERQPLTDIGGSLWNSARRSAPRVNR
jgi:hypothetical protein